MAYTTLGQMVTERAKSDPGAVAFRVRRGEAYHDLSWKEVAPRIERIAAGLLTAVPKLEDAAAVAIIGNTSLDWILTDFAALTVGLRTIPIYASLLPEEVGYAQVDTEVVIAVCEDAAQVEKVRAIRSGFRFFDVDYPASRVKIERIVVIHPGDLPAADDWESLEALERRGAERLEAVRADMAARAARIDREHTATYTYTSGTTGPPKAVVQTHDNMLTMLESTERAGLFNEGVRVNGLFLFLPLAHSFGRLIELAGPYFCTPIVLSTVPTLLEDLRLSRPGFFPSAPRVYEKMKAKIDGTVASASPLRRRLFRWAMRVGRAATPYRTAGKPLPRLLGLRYAVADRLVLAKLRDRLGLDKAELLLSGSAPLAVEVFEFFLAMGTTLLEGYGLTETCPALTATRPGKLKLGTVGIPFDCVTLKIADDGEILAKGRNITKGYHNRPDADADAFDAEGWFHTGDLGAIDQEGFVRITGRKKELIKTSGGKYVAPAKLEGRLKGLPFVQEAVVVGDRRKYVVALFALDTEGLETWCKQQGVPPEPHGRAVNDALQAHVDSVNKGLASFESVKYFRVLPGPLTVESGLLTASLKVKRRIVEERFAGLIEDMYRA